MFVTSDGIQGVPTGSREPVLRLSGQTANPFLLLFQTLDQPGVGISKLRVGINIYIRPGVPVNNRPAGVNLLLKCAI